MKGYKFAYFLLPSYINGKSIVLYTHETTGTYLITHETTGKKVLHSCTVDSEAALEELREEMNHSLCTRGEGAAYDIGVRYITGGE